MYRIPKPSLRALSSRNLTTRFRREESGVAAVEFAFIAPLLAVFLVGTTTVTQSLWANGKVSQTSSVIGDLIAQETDLDHNKFGEIMAAGPVLMEPFPIDSLKIEITAAIACHEDPTDTEDSVPEMFVVWSNGWEEDRMVDGPDKPGDPMNDSPEELSIEDGDYIVRTVVTYKHKPTISQNVGHEMEMMEQAYHQPRNNKPVEYKQKQGKKDQDCNDLMNR